LKKKLSLTMPHTYVIIGTIIFTSVILTYIIPAGKYDRILNPSNGIITIVSDSFRYVDPTPVNPFLAFSYIYQGMLDASNIIFFIFFSYGFIYMVVKTGAFTSGIDALISKIKGHEKLIIPTLMLVFGILSAFFGFFEEVYALFPIIIFLAIALGYDSLVGFAIIYLGIAVGFSAGVTNPFTIGVAQSISGLPLYSGILFRLLAFCCFMAIGILYTMRYASKVKHNGELSLVKDINPSIVNKFFEETSTHQPFSTLHKLTLMMLLLTMIISIFGTLFLAWGFSNLSALYILMMLVIGLINNFTLSQIAGVFVEASSTIIFGALVIGFSRAILLVLQNGQIIDTIIHGFYTVLYVIPPAFAACGMLLLQNLLNLFIPSGSGQAAATMPLLLPLSDLLHVNRQIAVLAFQYGDGFSDMLWPNIVIVECSLAGIPLTKWYKFFMPLFFCFLVLQIILILIASAISYGPF